MRTVFYIVGLLYIGQVCSALPTTTSIASKNKEITLPNGETVNIEKNHHLQFLWEKAMEADFFTYLPGDIELQHKNENRRATDKCVDVSQVCTSSVDCCGYPKSVCILYVNDTEFTALCSPRWFYYIMHSIRGQQEDPK